MSPGVIPKQKQQQILLQIGSGDYMGIEPCSVWGRPRARQTPFPSAVLSLQPPSVDLGLGDPDIPWINPVSMVSDNSWKFLRGHMCTKD